MFRRFRKEKIITRLRIYTNFCNFAPANCNLAKKTTK